MVGRVPIRIYKLKQSKQGITGSSPTVPPIPDSKYLYGVDDTNITNKNYPTIVITASAVPGWTGDISGAVEAFAVLYDTNNRPYIELDTFTFYIRQSKKSETEQLPAVFEFYVNPQHLTPSYKKLITEIRTRGGYEIQHWGEALTEVQVTGISGGMHKNSIGKALTKTEDVTESTAWKRLSQLKQLYDDDHSMKNQEALTLLGMNYFDKYYVGYFVSFQGPEADKDQPYLVTYSFSFKVQQEMSMQLAVVGGLVL